MRKIQLLSVFSVLVTFLGTTNAFSDNSMSVGRKLEKELGIAVLVAINSDSTFNSDGDCLYQQEKSLLDQLTHSGKLEQAQIHNDFANKGLSIEFAAPVVQQFTQIYATLCLGDSSQGCWIWTPNSDDGLAKNSLALNGSKLEFTTQEKILSEDIRINRTNSENAYNEVGKLNYGDMVKYLNSSDIFYHNGESDYGVVAKGSECGALLSLSDIEDLLRK